MGRSRNEEELNKVAGTRRLYVNGLAALDFQAVQVEQFFRGEKNFSDTMKALVLKGLEQTAEERIRFVKIYAVVHGCTFEQAWLRIVTGRAEELDFSDLTEAQFQELDQLFGQQTIYEIRKD
jgi:hypothetical protein